MKTTQSYDDECLVGVLQRVPETEVDRGRQI